MRKLLTRHDIIPCTIVLCDKVGPIQQAGYQLTGYRFKWLH